MRVRAQAPATFLAQPLAIRPQHQIEVLGPSRAHKTTEGRYRMGSRNITIWDLYANKLTNRANDFVAWITLAGWDPRNFETVTPNILCKIFCLVAGVNSLLLNFVKVFLNIFYGRALLRDSGVCSLKLQGTPLISSIQQIQSLNGLSSYLMD